MNTIVNVQGVVSARRAEAKKEINEYLAVFKNGFSSAEIGIARIIVAADFERTVGNLLSGLKEEGYKYRAGRRSVRAVGKTLRAVDRDGISFSIVIDGKYLGNWGNDEKISRFEIFFHEFIHAFLDKKRFVSMGAAGFRNDYRTIEGVCFSLALTRDEYIADSYLDVLCKKTFTDDKEEPVGLKKLNAARGIDYLETFMRLLDDMPVFIGTQIMEFKAGKKKAGEIWNAICELVEEILTVFAHLAGSREKEDDWDAVKKMISGSAPYRRYLSGHLKNIYLEWINYFSDDYDEAESLGIIQAEIREIFHNCGLAFKNVEDGIYITVNTTG